MSTPAATVAGRERMLKWDRDRIIEKIQRWVELYGEPPRSADWNPSAAKWSGASWRIERYNAGDPETGEQWPSLNAAKRLFDGSLSQAIVAAGFEPNKPGPPSARRLRAEPELGERVALSPLARVAISAAEADVKKLTKRLAARDDQLDRARERVLRAAAEVEMAKRQTGAAERRASQAEARVARAEADAFDRRAAPAAVERKVKTEVKKVAVPDTASKAKLARALAKVDRLTDELAVNQRAQRASKSEAARTANRLARAEAKVEATQGDLDEAVRLRKNAEDRLAAAEAVPVRVERVEVESANDRDVREANSRAHEAEVRAARAERQMREMGAAVTGEDRKLTAEEIAELRKGGASGSGVLIEAFKATVAARSSGSKTELAAALTKLASAAIRWRDAVQR